MADLIIHGMEMPKAGNWKTIRIYPDGTCSAPNWQGDCRVLSCIAVPLTEGHGRLIDADELRKAMYHEAFETDSPMQKWESGCWIRYKMFERNLEIVPTIVPADVADNYVGSKSEEGETDDSKL